MVIFLLNVAVNDDMLECIEIQHRTSRCLNHLADQSLIQGNGVGSRTPVIPEVQLIKFYPKI